MIGPANCQSRNATYEHSYALREKGKIDPRVNLTSRNEDLREASGHFNVMCTSFCNSVFVIQQLAAEYPSSVFIMICRRVRGRGNTVIRA